jgi:hypothetical protein
MPAHTTQAVELLRFVTAYKQGVEAMVDITPYSALLKASSETDGDLTFFAFIDTWVGNNSRQMRDVMALSSDSSKCKPAQKEEEAWGGGGQYGNGWQLDANLVFFPKAEGAAVVDTRPRESVTLSSGYYGQYSFGAITVHEGQMAGGGSQIQLKEAADLTGTLDAEVYPCRGGASDVQRGLKMGQRAKRLSAMGVVSPSAFQSDIEDVFNDIKNDATKHVTVTSTNPETRQVEVTFDKNQIEAAVGTPVFYHPDDIIMQEGSNTSFNKDTEVGKVISVDGNKATIQMTGACLPSTLHLNVPRLRLAKTPDALVVARTLADSLKTVKDRMPGQIDAEDDAQPQEDAISLLARRKKREEARRAAKDRKNIELNFQAPAFKPFLVGQDENTALSPLPIIGRVDLGALERKGITCAPNVLSLLQEEEHEESLMQRDVQVAQKVEGQQKIYPIIANAVRQMAVGKIATGMPVAVAGAPLATAERMLEEAGATGTPGLPQPKSPTMQDGDKVCILARHAQGRVFERKFMLPTFFPAVEDGEGAGGATTAAKKNDHALLQFAVTGHGWSGSTEQCSEFCHAIYHIIVNGNYAFNVTEWRDDCQRNPIDGQFGTWTISRNGWCPGSVEPGLYLDMTKLLKNGENHIAVDVSVYSSKAGKYQPFINYGGFQGGDNAVLDIGATAFIYDGAAVDAIKNQDKAFSAAEKALRDGCSVPAALHKPEEHNAEFASYMQLSQTSESRNVATKTEPAKVVQQSQVKPHASLESHTVGNHYDFESTAPWYLYSKDKSGPPGRALGATIVPAFQDGLIQINSREIRVKVNKKLIPQEWGQLGVQLVLQRPGDDGVTELKDLEMDHWDRVGSFGLVYEETAASTTDTANSMVKLHPSQGRRLQKTFSLL